MPGPLPAGRLPTAGDTRVIRHSMSKLVATPRLIWKPALVKAGVIAEPARDGRSRRRYVTTRKEGIHQLRHYYASVQLLLTWCENRCEVCGLDEPQNEARPSRFPCSQSRGCSKSYITTLHLFSPASRRPVVSDSSKRAGQRRSDPAAVRTMLSWRHARRRCLHQGARRIPRPQRPSLHAARVRPHAAVLPRPCPRGHQRAFHPSDRPGQLNVSSHCHAR